MSRAHAARHRATPSGGIAPRSIFVPVRRDRHRHGQTFTVEVLEELGLPREISVAPGTETTDREVPVDAHAPHVVGDSASFLGGPHSPSVPGEPGHDAQGPPIFQIVVLGLEAVVCRPAHARRFGREVVFVLGGTAPLVVQPLGKFAGSV